MTRRPTPHRPSVSSLLIPPPLSSFFFFNATPTPEIYTLSLHDALPIRTRLSTPRARIVRTTPLRETVTIDLRAESRSEEHTSELQSRFDLVCRLLLEKKKKNKNKHMKLKLKFKIIT